MITLLNRDFGTDTTSDSHTDKTPYIVKGDNTFNELRFSLSNNLQSTLDLDEMLSSFYSKVSKFNHVTGIHYLIPLSDTRLAFGKTSANSAKYSISSENDNLGELVFFRKKTFTETELALLEVLIGILFYPLRNGLKYKKAIEHSLIDSLTGVNNRFALDLNFKREMKLSKRHKKALSVLLIDIDHFKSVNDTYGHLAGDKTLKEACHIIRQTLRETDQVFRYGGEEFVAVLNETNIDNALISAERIRIAIEQHAITSGDTAINITVSIGVSALRLQDSFDSLFARADKALYQAKNTGRNRVLTHKSDNTQSKQKIA